MKTYIKAISYYLPEKVVTNEELVNEFPEWTVDKIIKKIGKGTYGIAVLVQNENDEYFVLKYIDPNK